MRAVRRKGKRTVPCQTEVARSKAEEGNEFLKVRLRLQWVGVSLVRSGVACE